MTRPGHLLTLLVLGWLLFGNMHLRAQTPETRAYEAAVRAFEDGVFDLAEKDFAAFIQTYPASPRLPEAILYRARAALRQQQVKLASDLLTTNATRAGPLADQFQYWLAEVKRQGTNYQAAAELFARLVRDFPNSPRLLEATYGEALARFKLQEWPRVIDLLSNTNGTFQKLAAARPNDELVVRGQLLLAEALLETDAATDSALRPLATRELTPELRWRVQYLLCRGQLASRRADDALASSTNLFALAAAAGQRQFVAESYGLRGAILERLRQLEVAILEYERNLGETTPPEYRRQALLRIIELTLDQNKITEAAQKLESFLNQYPQDAASDVALFTLGEINLKRYLASLTNAAPATTNYLQAALHQFDHLITNSPSSPLIGKASLNRGWCLWFDGKMPEALLAFGAATNKLPRSEDRAVAQFKIADAQFQLRDFTNAVSSYRAVVDHYRLPQVEEELAGHALYQIVRASLEINDLKSAAAAMHQIVQSYDESPFAERGLLLLGQSFTQANKPADARALFERFLTRYPNSSLRAEVELAIARSYVHDNNWDAALTKYQEWMTRFPTNELRARAEYNFAYVNFQAGRLTNALTLFTNLLATFPGQTNAPRAKYWVGLYYYEQKQYAEAEYHFLGLVQNTNAWAVSGLACDARMMAARSAAARQDYKSAHQYCLDIANDTNCSPEITAEAFFALGDILTLEPADPAEPFARFAEAITAFSKVVQLFPTNSRAPLAWGRIGDCHRQMAALNPNSYQFASNAYEQVLSSPLADVAARSQAEVGLGQMSEQLARTVDPTFSKSAFNHYYNVVSGKNLRDGEKVDPHWFKEAGLAAGRVAEERQEWDVAQRVYTRLADVLPALRPTLEKKIEKTREQLRASSE
jgi:TolA-binding protein